MNVLMESDEAGLCLVDDPAHSSLHMFNHIEYDSNSLGDEYFRDVAAKSPSPRRATTFPRTTRRQPENRWRSHAHLLLIGKLDQRAADEPFDMVRIGSR